MKKIFFNISIYFSPCLSPCSGVSVPHYIKILEKRSIVKTNRLYVMHIKWIKQNSQPGTTK
ncbi:hypothetical protein B5G00_13875 [Blautia sp. An46]|nr:hypothetical protein B5G00_13875 [Blautia sp. An46]